MATLTLLVRTTCHLCDTMSVALAPLLAEFDVALEVLDIDRHPSLEAQYGILVPVLLHADRELCHYFLDRAGVRDYLARLG